MQSSLFATNESEHEQGCQLKKRVSIMGVVFIVKGLVVFRHFNVVIHISLITQRNKQQKDGTNQIVLH